MVKHTVEFACSCATISFDDQTLSDEIMSHIQSRPYTGMEPTVVEFHVGKEHGAETLFVTRGAERIYTGDEIDYAVRILISELITHCVDPYKTGVALHAGAVSKDGLSIAVPGVSGAGKTTFVAWLVHKGFDYITDEAITLDLDTLAIDGFFRPLHIKKSALDATRSIADKHVCKNMVAGSDGVTIAPPELFGKRAGNTKNSIRLIVFPEHKENASYAFVKLSAAQCAHRLIATLINARNLPNKGFDSASRMARKIPAYRLEYSEFEQLGDLAGQLIDLLDC